MTDVAGARRRWSRAGLWVGLVVAPTVAPLMLFGGLGPAVAVPSAVLACLAGRWIDALGRSLMAMGVGGALGVVGYWLLVRGSWAAAAFSVLLVLLLVVVVPWWAGRARQLQVDLRARERVAVERQAKIAERQAIARDVHDSLGHDLALIALRAGAWELTAGSGVSQAAAAEVRERATVATDRLHSVVRLLDESADAEVNIAADAGLTALVASARRDGLIVDLHGPVTTAGWSADVHDAVVRVVQESLTNVSKHAPGSGADVMVSDGDRVEVEVASPLPASAAAGGSGPGVSGGGGSAGGTGLRGLARRVEMLGGTFEAGPVGVVPGGAEEAVFRVRASVPRTAAAEGTDGTADGVLRGLSRRARRRRVLTALLPAGLALALAGTLIGTHVITVTQTALPPERYASLELGQHRSEFASQLPPKTQQSAPPVVRVTPAPAGSRCELYQARASVFDLGQSMFRLCFDLAADPRLVAKDHLLVEG